MTVNIGELQGGARPNIVAETCVLTIDMRARLRSVPAALGVPIPAEMDGRMLVGALPQWLLERFPPNYEPSELPPQEPSHTAEPAAVDGLVSERLGRLMDEASR